MRIRVAYNYTDIHRTHEPIGFSAPDIGIKTFSYIEDYLLVSVQMAVSSLVAAPKAKRGSRPRRSTSATT